MVTFRQRHGYREPSLVIQGEPNDPSHVLFVDQWQCVTSISLINKYLISVLLRVNLDNLHLAWHMHKLHFQAAFLQTLKTWPTSACSFERQTFPS